MSSGASNNSVRTDPASSDAGKTRAAHLTFVDSAASGGGSSWGGPAALDASMLRFDAGPTAAKERAQRLLKVQEADAASKGSQS